jgi:hypothetical protein
VVSQTTPDYEPTEIIPRPPQRTPLAMSRQPTPQPVPRAPTPTRDSAPELPPPPPVLSRALTPQPGAVPILDYQVPQPGTMVSHPGQDSSQPMFTHAVDVGDRVVARAPPQFDVTDRVRAPRIATPTNFVRAAPRRKGPIIALAVCAALAGGIGTFIAFGGGSTEALPVKVAAPAQAEPAPTPTPLVAPAPTPTAEIPTPTAEVPPLPPPVAEPAVVDPAPVVEPAPVPTHIATPTPAKTKPVIAKKPPVRPRPHPTTKPKPEEKPAWDADSPFMPVRTDKH